VIIGLAVTRDGIPVKHWVFSGNTMDMSTIEQVKKDLVAWRLSRVVFVHDEGMTSASNLQYLQRGGGHYIAGCKLRSGEARAEHALSHKGPYTTIDENLFAKEIILGDGAKRQRLVLVKNTQEQKRADETRQQTWSHVRNEMQRLHCGEFEIESKKFRQLTALTTEQKQLLKELNIKEPSTIVDIQDV